MPIHREPGWEVLCDGCYDSMVGAMTRKEAEEQAGESGWHRKGSKVYCNRCWETIKRGEHTLYGE